MNSKSLRKLHLYLGTIFAPVLLLFTISGAWQVFRLNDAQKDGSYTPLKAVKILSAVHKNQTTAKEIPQKTALKYFVLAACVALVTTTTLGIVMAYRFTASPAKVTICLLIGAALPVILLLLSPSGSPSPSP
jgi:hypothetical protein